MSLDLLTCLSRLTSGELIPAVMENELRSAVRLFSESRRSHLESSSAAGHADSGIWKPGFSLDYISQSCGANSAPLAILLRGALVTELFREPIERNWTEEFAIHEIAAMQLTVKELVSEKSVVDRLDNLATHRGDP